LIVDRTCLYDTEGDLPPQRISPELEILQRFSVNVENLQTLEPKQWSDDKILHAGIYLTLHGTLSFSAMPRLLIPIFVNRTKESENLFWQLRLRLQLELFDGYVEPFKKLDKANKKPSEAIAENSELEQKVTDVCKTATNFHSII